jgi:peptide-methionine (S)-S-oxide reductase
MIRFVRRSVLLMLAAAMYTATAQAAGNGFPVPALDDSLSASKELRTVVLAGGCFWGMEEVFQHVRGVTDVVSGYAGGSARNAKYDLVSTGTTGHAESVKITYDASAVTLGRLLQIYFSVAHDPTQKDGQGPDTGPQYRSSIFFSNQRQQQVASAYIKQLGAAKVYRAPLTTEVVALEGFYPAEAYHQDYAAHHPNDRYIVMVDKPKVDALHKYWADVWTN